MTEHELRKALGKSREQLAEVKVDLTRDGVSTVKRYELMDEHDRLIPSSVRELSDAVDALVYG